MILHHHTPAPMPVEAIGWGTWPEIVAAVVTSLAFVVAATSLVRDLQVRREAQARLVYSKLIHIEQFEAGATFDLLPHGAVTATGSAASTIILGQGLGLAVAPVQRVTVIVHNGSNELIGPARVQMVNAGKNYTYDTFSLSVGAIDPLTDYTAILEWPWEEHPNMPSLATTVIFRDASGRWWRRHRSEPIERVHADPENEVQPAAERAEIRKVQAARGVAPEHFIQEPKVSLVVRWHRLLRRVRGKSPIP